MPEFFLTVGQTAERLQIHPESVRRQLQRGQLRGIKRGKLWRIPESALQEQAPISSRSAERQESAEIGVDERAALFAPPDAEETQNRLTALARLGKNTPPRNGWPPLTDDAVAQGYAERVGVNASPAPSIKEQARLILADLANHHGPTHNAAIVALARAPREVVSIVEKECQKVAAAFYASPEGEAELADWRALDGEPWLDEEDGDEL